MLLSCISFWQPEHQQIIVDAGALSHLVSLLKRQRDVHRDGSNSRAVNSVIRRAADAITNLAHENSSIKTRVRFANFVDNFLSILYSAVSLVSLWSLELDMQDGRWDSSSG